MKSATEMEQPQIFMIKLLPIFNIADANKL